MQILSARQARLQLTSYNLLEISELLRDRHGIVDDLTHQTMYLARLCALGDIPAVKKFITRCTPIQLTEILNHPHYLMYDGTVLHETLHWNTGNTAIDLFQLLCEHGAESMQNYYGSFPWEDYSIKWIDTLACRHLSGGRNFDEFDESYQYIREAYAHLCVNIDKSASIAPPTSQDDNEYADMPPLITPCGRLIYHDDEDNEYADMPPLITPCGRLIYKDNEYADMPALIPASPIRAARWDEFSENDEYADMPPFVNDSPLNVARRLDFSTEDIAKQFNRLKLFRY